MRVCKEHTSLVLPPSSPALYTSWQAYVEQNDNFYSMLTVAETLTMSSQLQLSPGMTADAKELYVDNLISVLGLAKVKCYNVTCGSHVSVSDSMFPSVGGSYGLCRWNFSRHACLCYLYKVYATYHTHSMCALCQHMLCDVGQAWT